MQPLHDVSEKESLSTFISGLAIYQYADELALCLCPDMMACFHTTDQIASADRQHGAKNTV